MKIHSAKIFLSIAVLVLTISAGVIIYTMSKPKDIDMSEDSKVKITNDVAPLIATTVRTNNEASLVDHIENLKKSKGIKSQYIQPIPSVEWSKQDVIAVEFSLYVARTFEKASLEDIDGHPTIIISVKEPAEGCVSTQVNEQNVVFVAVPKDTKTYQTLQRFIKNDATCSL